MKQDDCLPMGKMRARVTSYHKDIAKGMLWVEIINILPGKRVRATPCVPYAGNGLGMLFIPPLQSTVWVEFVGGDPNDAVWSGGYWGEEASVKPPMALGKTASAGNHVIKTEKTEILISKEEGLKVKLDKMTATFAGGKVTIASDTGKVEITSGKIEIDANGAKISIAPGSTAMSGSSEVSVKPKSAMTVEASKIDLKGALDVGSGKLKVP